MTSDHARGGLDAFAHTGEMGVRVLAFDWSKTPLGAIDEWPRSLFTLVHMVLSSPHPMFLWWGPELIQIYNDGYRPSLDEDRDKGALGAHGEEFWADTWPIISPDIRAVMEHGESVWYENRLVPIVRNNRVEEVYWTYSFSPVLDDAGGVGGTLVTVRGVTSDVLRERRTRTLRTIAERATAEASTAEEISRVVSEALSEASGDIAFELLYLFDEDGILRLYHSNEALPADARPLTVSLNGRFPDASVWPLAEVVATGESRFISDLRERVGVFPGGRWSESADRALVLPVATETGQVFGVLIAGLSPRLGLD